MNVFTHERFRIYGNMLIGSYSDRLYTYKLISYYKLLFTVIKPHTHTILIKCINNTAHISIKYGGQKPLPVKLHQLEAYSKYQQL